MDWQKKKVRPWNEMLDTQSCLLSELQIEGRLSAASISYLGYCC